MTDARRSLLVVEDDPALQTQMKWAFDAYDVAVASDREEAIAQLRRVEPAVVTLDLGLPPETGSVERGLPHAREDPRAGARHQGHRGHRPARQRQRAACRGARCATTSSPSRSTPAVVSLIIDRAFRMHDLQVENRRLLGRARRGRGGIITGAPEMLEVCRMIDKVAATNATVAAARRVGHRQGTAGARAARVVGAQQDKRFVAINCAAIPDTLLESELFGYERARSPGPTSRRRAASRPRTTARCSSTRSATCRCRCRRSCCASCRSGRSSGSAGATRFRSTCASSARRTRTCATASPRVCSARTCSTAWPRSSSRCRRCATVPGDAVLLAHAFVRRFADEQKRGRIEPQRRGRRRHRAPSLAGQRARARERDQACRDPHRRSDDQGAATSASRARRPRRSR